MTRQGLVAVFLLAGGVTAAAPAGAQNHGPALRPHRLTLSGGVTWWGSYPVGARTASLRGNGFGPTNPTFTLFRAETDVNAAPGGEVRLGYAFTRSLAIELGAAVHRPGLTTRIQDDPEALAVTTLDAERLAQATVDLGLTWQLPRVVIAGRVRPFVSGGGGYLRQLYSERTLVETGEVYYLGGGIRAFLRGGDGRRRALGIRADVRALWRRNGVEFEDRTRVVPMFGVQWFAEF